MIVYIELYKKINKKQMPSKSKKKKKELFIRFPPFEIP